jgi:hypothetical protein
MCEYRTLSSLLSVRPGAPAESAEGYRSLFRAIPHLNRASGTAIRSIRGGKELADAEIPVSLQAVLLGESAKKKIPIHRVVARHHQRDTEDVNVKVRLSHFLGAEYFCLDDGLPFFG